MKMTGRRYAKPICRGVRGECAERKSGFLASPRNDKDIDRMTNKDAMRTLTEDEVKAKLDPERLIAALEDGFRNRFSETLIPVRTQMKLANGVFLMMPCYDRNGRGLGVKLVMVAD